ncbi:hypothetical protein PGB90_006379 [Kerria lacca]
MNPVPTPSITVVVSAGFVFNLFLRKIRSTPLSLLMLDLTGFWSTPIFDRTRI